MASGGARANFKNKRILITSGPTWVPIDPMRVLSNRASGELGRRMAMAFSDAGARVTLLEGPVTQPLISKKITIKKFCFFEELSGLLRSELKKKYAIVIHNAAVSDYRLRNVFGSKLNSGKKNLTLTLVPTEKLINGIKKTAPSSFVVGFKLEDFRSEKEITAEARKLIVDSDCDAVVANTLRGGYRAYILDKTGKILGRADSRNQLTHKLLNYLKAVQS